MYSEYTFIVTAPCVLLYLSGDILEVSTIRKNDIVAGAQLNMTVWQLWVSLVQAVVSGDLEQV